jgi:hypothetical protein
VWLGKNPKYSTRWEDPKEWLFTPVEQAAWTLKHVPARGRMACSEVRLAKEKQQSTKRNARML